MQRHSIEGERPSLAGPPLSLHLEVWSFGMNGVGSVTHRWAAGSWVLSDADIISPLGSGRQSTARIALCRKTA